ncbi:MAG: isomerase [Candidatus Sericytochromatia bacterium]|nr:MAG: isomerase [Candidatus Sericytochromatia bacterium]
MKALIIGYGSIGKRHFNILKNIPLISKVDIISNHYDNSICKSIYEFKDFDYYDYFIIASKTYLHYEHLCYIENNTKNKIILCEKPLFHEKKNLTIKNNNVYVGYNLRYHSLIEKLKILLSKNHLSDILYVDVLCESYLPNWRKNVDYRDSYSAKKEEGGGVLLDLSHEIDYIQFLFGKIVEIKSFQKKLSNLEINSDDFLIAIGRTIKNIYFTLRLNYFSKKNNRKISINTNDKYYEIDLFENRWIEVDLVNETTNKLIQFNIDETYYKMHYDVLQNNEYSCDYNQALETMRVISQIQEENL